MKLKPIKLIDWDARGHVVRFYFGNAGLKDWYGDDWDDAPYQYNAERVYEKFVSYYLDIAFPFDFQLMEPHSGNINYRKDDFKRGTIPFMVVATTDPGWWLWGEAVAHKDTIKFYMGERYDKFSNKIWGLGAAWLGEHRGGEASGVLSKKQMLRSK